MHSSYLVLLLFFRSPAFFGLVGGVGGASGGGFTLWMYFRPHNPAVVAGALQIAA